MIERKFVTQNKKGLQVRNFLSQKLTRVGLSDVKLIDTPLGEKIVVYANKPGLVVGRQGSNIQSLTKDLKLHFDFENPQIEVAEVKNAFADAHIVAESIVNYLVRFGTARFKGIGYKALTNVMKSGALGVEILISGRIPSSRAKTWRFYKGYLKKCGDISITGVKKAQMIATLKVGVIGVKVSILPAGVVLPDHVGILDTPVEVIEEVKTDEVVVGSDSSEKKETKTKSSAKKKTTKKKLVKESFEKKETETKPSAKKKTTKKKSVKESSEKKETLKDDVEVEDVKTGVEKTNVVGDTK